MKEQCLIYKMNELTKAANDLKSVMIRDLVKDIRLFFDEIKFIFKGNPEKKPEEIQKT